jgi:hypothetical protein
MDAETRTLQDVLHGDRRFLVPIYQRPYVWEREKQWEPLWEDVEATAVRLADARVTGHMKGLEAPIADKTAAPHFLGAVVLERSPTMTGDVETRVVVDGQQRMTTVQLLLRGVLDALDIVESKGTVRARVRKAILNDDEVVEPSELLKVTPRRAEREAFNVAMGPTAPDSGASTFAAARAFFAESALGFLRDQEVPQDPYAADAGASGEEGRASLLAATLLGLVKLVVIDLDDVDDAQVIFEALNARNTPLSATDLVKNMLFLRAQSEHHDPEVLYETSWRRFDDDSDWWLEAVGTGHAQRARQDWLLGDWLIAQLGRTINVGRLYGEFRRWLDDSGSKALDAMATLTRYADAYEQLNGRRAGASPAELVAYSRIERLNITVATPVLLWLLVQPPDVLPSAERTLAVRAIESYVVRRMAGKYQTRAYGQAFVEILKAAQAAPTHAGLAVIAALRNAPHGYEWPTTNDLELAFADGRYYGPGGINQDRLRLLLGEVDRVLQGQAHKSESVTFEYEDLQIEHVIPQSWRTYWPVTEEESSARLVAEADRERHVNRIGNLTLATAPLNNSMSNDPWAAKRVELKKHSKLELNALLVSEESWSEGSIVERGKWLARRLDEIWPPPDAALWAN